MKNSPFLQQNLLSKRKITIARKIYCPLFYMAHKMLETQNRIRKTKKHFFKYLKKKNERKPSWKKIERMEKKTMKKSARSEFIRVMHLLFCHCEHIYCNRGDKIHCPFQTPWKTCPTETIKSKRNTKNKTGVKNSN